PVRPFEHDELTSPHRACGDVSSSRCHPVYRHSGTSYIRLRDLVPVGDHHSSVGGTGELRTVRDGGSAAGSAAGRSGWAASPCTSGSTSGPTSGSVSESALARVWLNIRSHSR